MDATKDMVEENTPHRVKMSYADYLEAAGDSQIVEWVEGETINYRPPTNTHQNISRLIFLLLDSFIQFFKLGVIIYAPFEVKLWPDGPAREPDILFISNENLPNLGKKRLNGGPDLIIEIISPGSVTEDRVRKFSEYERAGVKEYWIIDPRPHQQQADFYRLGDDGEYHDVSVEADGRFYSQVLPNFWLSVAWLWQEPLLNPQLGFAEIMLSIDDLSDEIKDAYQALYNVLNAQE
ncbi:MAG: Uma2 family endonuclease [Anaerolineae bacterium]|nr:Uma2 family endonuclease [Anaerolineae bacterium]